MQASGCVVRGRVRIGGTQLTEHRMSRLASGGLLLHMYLSLVFVEHAAWPGVVLKNMRVEVSTSDNPGCVCASMHLRQGCDHHPNHISRPVSMSHRTICLLRMESCRSQMHLQMLVSPMHVGKMYPQLGAQVCTCNGSRFRFQEQFCEIATRDASRNQRVSTAVLCFRPSETLFLCSRRLHALLHCQSPASYMQHMLSQ